MRIALNARYLTSPYSGIGQYTINLIEALAQIDHKNEYLLFVPWPIDLSFGKNFKIIDIRESHIISDDYLSRTWWEQITLSRALQKYKPDIYHSLYQSLPLRANKVPTIVTIHDTIPWKFPWERKNPFYRWYADIARWSCRKAKLVFCVSENAKAEISLVYGIRPEKMIVTYQGVNKIYYEKPSRESLANVKKKFKLKRPFLLYVGGFKRHKNLRFTIKSFAYAIKKYKLDIDLVIPGKIRQHSGSAKQIFFDPQGLQRYAKTKEVNNYTKFIGYVKIEELAALYNICHAFISLSLYEGFGLPALEAMVSGKPVIVSNTGAYPEVVGNAGVIVYPYGLHRIADAIKNIFNDEKLYFQLKENALKRIKQFNNIQIAKEILDIYRNVRNIHQ